MGRLTAAITGKFLAFDTSPLIYYTNSTPSTRPLPTTSLTPFIGATPEP